MKQHDDFQALQLFAADDCVLRAYHYIKLAGFFGDVPLVTKSLGLVR